MQAERYTDRSIAIFGDTKPWDNDLARLGGKFNGNLRGRPGWIYSNNKEAEILNFIALANAGKISPSAPSYVQPQQFAQPQMVPFNQQQPALSPTAAVERLKINSSLPTIAPLTGQPGMVQLPLTGTAQGAFQQPLGAFQQPLQAPATFQQPLQAPATFQQPLQAPATFQQPLQAPGAFQQPLGAFQQPLQQGGARLLPPPPRTLVSDNLPPLAPPSVVRVNETTTTSLNFPNRFVAADGLSYRIVVTTVVEPQVDMIARVSKLDTVTEYKVEQLLTPTKIILTNDENREVVRLVGEGWMICDGEDDLPVTFTLPPTSTTTSTITSTTTATDN